MASASALNDEFDSVETKSEIKSHDKQSIEDLRKKAFVPKNLPEDFLRIILDKNNINEDTDTLLAQQLFYDLNRSNFVQYNQYNLMNRIDWGRGRLRVDIVEAKLNKNYGLTRMDPYVKFTLGKKVFETPTSQSGGKNPIWKKSIYCPLPQDVDTLLIQIYDEKAFTEDEMIAFVKFPLPSTLFDGIPIDEWVPLSGKLGEQKEGYINIHLQLFKTEPVRVNNQIRSPQSSISNSSSSSSSATSPTLRNPLNQPNVVNLPPEIVNPLSNDNSHSQVTYTEADLKEIKEMFPSFDEEVVKSILESSNSKEAAIEVLLQMAADT